jgi:hypothetical protein
MPVILNLRLTFMLGAESNPFLDYKTQCSKQYKPVLRIPYPDPFTSYQGIEMLTDPVLKSITPKGAYSFR